MAGGKPEESTNPLQPHLESHTQLAGNQKHDEVMKSRIYSKPAPNNEATKYTVGERECFSLTPSGEDLTENEIDKFVFKTQHILQLCQSKIDRQKIDSHSLAFMVLRTKESLDGYGNDYISKLNVFLMQADIITSKYYAQMCCTLPKFGDCIRAIETESDYSMDYRGIQRITKEELKLVKSVRDNYYAMAMLLKSGRHVIREVNKTLPHRKYLVDIINAPMPIWMEIQDGITCQLDDIREQIFQILTHLNFQKQGETRIVKDFNITAIEGIISSDCSKDSSDSKVGKQTTNNGPQVATKKISEQSTNDLSNNKNHNLSTPDTNVIILAENEQKKSLSEVLKPNTSKNEDAEPPDTKKSISETKLTLEQKMSTEQTKETLEDKVTKPNETDDDSDDDIFHLKGRIRKYNK